MLKLVILFMGTIAHKGWGPQRINQTRWRATISVLELYLCLSSVSVQVCHVVTLTITPKCNVIHSVSSFTMQSIVSNIWLQKIVTENRYRGTK